MMNYAVRYHFSSGLKLKRDCGGNGSSVQLWVCVRETLSCNFTSLVFPKTTKKKNNNDNSLTKNGNLFNLLFSVAFFQATVPTASSRLLRVQTSEAQKTFSLSSLCTFNNVQQFRAPHLLQLTFSTVFFFFFFTNQLLDLFIFSP